MDMPMTKNIGPAHPSPAVISEMAIPARIGLAVPFKSESPRPASGPMRAVLTALMESGSISPSVAYLSSMAAATPTGMALVMSLVRKYSICLEYASFFSSGSS